MNSILPPPFPFRYMCKQVQPSCETFTKYVSLLWVDVSQPWSELLHCFTFTTRREDNSLDKNCGNPGNVAWIYSVAFLLSYTILRRFPPFLGESAVICFSVQMTGRNIFSHSGILKADSHIACRAHAVPLPCRAAKGLGCAFPI